MFLLRRCGLLLLLSFIASFSAIDRAEAQAFLEFCGTVSVPANITCIGDATRTDITINAVQLRDTSGTLVNIAGSPTLISLTSANTGQAIADFANSVTIPAGEYNELIIKLDENAATIGNVIDAFDGLEDCRTTTTGAGAESSSAPELQNATLSIAPEILDFYFPGTVTITQTGGEVIFTINFDGFNLTINEGDDIQFNIHMPLILSGPLFTFVGDPFSGSFGCDGTLTQILIAPDFSVE